MTRNPYQDAPAALFYLLGAAYGTAAGIVSALPVPEPKKYVLRVLKNVWDSPNWGVDAAAGLPAPEAADVQLEHSMLPIVACGGKQCGKTTLMRWWSTGHRPAACKPTVGADLFATELCIERHVVSVQVWDTAGGMGTLERLGPRFWREAAAYLYVVNVSDASSFDTLTSLCSLLQDQRGAAASLESRPAVLLGARHQSSADSKRQITVEQAEAWCHARGAVYLEMRNSEDVAAVDVAIELLVRACVCPVPKSIA